MDGFLNIDKPAGVTSAAVVAMVRRAVGEKRVGHAGTLDPDATGVLPVMTGRATRLFDYLLEKDKEYEAVVAFGSSTDTQDASGRVVETGTDYPRLDEVEKRLPELTGDIMQIPSAYSAIKQNGKPLYKLARSGRAAEAPPRLVRVEELKVTDELPDHAFRLNVRCGSGTYVRTICHDLGRLCGCPAHMRSLRRTRSGPFDISGAVTPDEMFAAADAGKLAGLLLPVDYPLSGIVRADIEEKCRKRVSAGAAIPIGEVRLSAEAPDGANVRMYLCGIFWGIAWREGDMLKWRALLQPETELG